MDLPALGGLPNPPHSSVALLFVAGGRGALAGSEHVMGKGGEKGEGRED